MTISIFIPFAPSGAEVAMLENLDFVEIRQLDTRRSNDEELEGALALIN
ncbi:hypothetical protein [Coriobacterium glomerans]|nr:hypothetical protein [Coriobacterium glomerans]